ncbi:MAG: dihydroorotate dehydrogenase electron transfer subunit [Chthonomonadales bacterium]
MRYQLDALIIDHKQLADFEFELTLKAPQIAKDSLPGQFVQILYDQSYNPFTRRPFSVYKVNPHMGTFSIVYLARGVFTQGLRNKRPGETLSIVGPLGNFFRPSTDPEAVHILVAGGVGAPPLYFHALQMVDEGHDPESIYVINGARTRDMLVGIEEFEQLPVNTIFTTDDGSYGQKGIVTGPLLDILDQTTKPVQVYTCGPTPMLRAVGDLCNSRKVSCQVSVETVMPCGVGVCMGCVVKIKIDPDAEPAYLRSCYEGPVFNAEQVIWE